jgi:WD40 repeat protein
LQQGVVKQWDLVSGKNIATYIGGTGLVRCLGIPGVSMETTATTVPIKEEEEEEEEGKEDGKEGEGKEEAKSESKTQDDDPYADDPTFNVVNEEEEEAKKRAALKRKKAKKHRINSHRLTAFVSGGDDVSLRLWDCTRTSLVAELSSDNLGAMKNIATCVGRPAVVLSGHRAGEGRKMGAVAVWDINGRVEMGRLEDVHEQEVAAMAVSECGNKLFTAGGADDPTIKEWDLRMMKKVKNVGYHTDRVLSLAVLTKPNQSYVFSAGKDSTVGISMVSKAGVVKSKLVAEITDFQGLNNAISLVPMKLGDVSFAGGQKRKSKPDIYTVSGDKNLRLYDLSDVINLSSPDAVDAHKGIEKNVKNMKLSAEDNYHAKQTEVRRRRGGAKRERPMSPVGKTNPLFPPSSRFAVLGQLPFLRGRPRVVCEYGRVQHDWQEEAR